MSLLRTLLLDFKLIETGNTTRRFITSDNVSYLSTTGLEVREGTLAPNTAMAFAAIEGALFVRCNAPLVGTINNGTNFVINALLVNFGTIASFNLINNSQIAVNYIIATA